LFAAFVAVSPLITVAGGVIAAGPIAGDLPAPAILIDDTGLLGQVGPRPAGEAPAAEQLYVPLSDDPYHTGDAYSTGIQDQYVVVSDDPYHTGDAYSTGLQAPYVVISDDPFHTGDAYSTGSSPLARQAWLPSPAVGAVLFV